MFEIDEIKNVFENLVLIDSPSLEEGKIAEHIKEMFGKIGVELTEDQSGKITGSNSGNLYGLVLSDLVSESVAGSDKPLLLAAHMDTVNPAKNKKAIFHEDGKVTSDGSTVLGADDLAAVTAIYEAVKFLKEQNIPHRPLEILFTTGEELYCKGAKAFDFSKIKSKEVLVPDLSGELGTAAFAAPTILSFSVSVTGKAAHAGFNPNAGINAIRAAAEAVAALPQGQLDEITTGNIGVISGGEGINIVSEKCVVKGEIRSLKHEKALKVAEEYRAAFEESAYKYGAEVEWLQNIDIQAYENSLKSDIVQSYISACKGIGIEPKLIKTFGGSDNNVFAQQGIEGLVIATSMYNVHSTSEYTNLKEIAKVAELLVEITK